MVCVVVMVILLLVHCTIDYETSINHNHIRQIKQPLIVGMSHLQSFFTVKNSFNMTHNTHYMYPVKFRIDHFSLDNGITMKLSEDGCSHGCCHCSPTEETIIGNFII